MKLLFIDNRITFTCTNSEVILNGGLGQPGPALAHGTTGAKRTIGAPPHYIKICKKCEALQYCDSNEFIELTVDTSRVLMSKAATNNICSNKHKS
jgi:hypothetical protein